MLHERTLTLVSLWRPWHPLWPVELRLTKLGGRIPSNLGCIVVMSSLLRSCRVAFLVQDPEGFGAVPCGLWGEQTSLFRTGPLLYLGSHSGQMQLWYTLHLKIIPDHSHNKQLPEGTCFANPCCAGQSGYCGLQRIGGIAASHSMYVYSSISPCTLTWD